MVGDVLEAADAELYYENDFENDDQNDDTGRYAPQVPQEKKSRLSRADVLKEAAQIVQKEEDREVEIALNATTKELGGEIRKSKEQKKDAEVEDDDLDSVDGDPTDADQELRFACYHGVQSDCRRALRNGGNIMRKDKEGWLPIHWAAAHGHDQIIDILLESRSLDTEKKKLRYINAQESLTGFTPLHLSSIGGHLKCLDRLLCYGADYKIKNDQNESAAEMLTSKLSRKDAASNLGHHVLIRLNPDLLKIQENILKEKDINETKREESYDGNDTRK